MECESSDPMDEMENTFTATAHPQVSSASMPDLKDQLRPLSFDAPVANTTETSDPITYPQKYTIHAYPLHDDSGIEHSAAELTDTEGPVREEELPHIPPTIPHDPHGLISTQTSPMDTLQPDSLATEQSHTMTTQFPSQEEVYEVQDDAQYDVDSAYDADSIRNDDTETLASFITNYRWENGRRYHAYSDGAYWGPNDEDANDGQDLAHHLYKLTLDQKLHLAPIENPHNILDLGTGTGIWAIEIADLYPSAHVIGTDLSPIQPTFVPPNCHFEIEDVNLEWTYPRNHFDFIHVRELFGSVDDWDRFFLQSLAALKPGAYLEILEHSVQPVSDDETAGPESFYRLWGDTVIEMGERRGKSFSIWKESRERMEKAGFEGLVETRYKWPMNGWSKDPKLRELGQWNQLRLYDGIEGMMIRMLTNAGGWSYQRAQVFLAEMRKALKDYTIHAYLEVSVVYGRKPLTNHAPPS